MLVPGSIPNIILSKSFKVFSLEGMKYWFKNTSYFALLFFFISAIYLSLKIDEFNLQFSQLKEYFSLNFCFYLVLVLFFQIVNWTLEAIKFKILLNKYNPISLIESIKAVYVGNFTALTTPERIGNFIGRILIIKKDKKLITILTMLGNSFQLLITVGMAIFSLTAILFSDTKIDYLHNNETFVLTGFYLLFFTVLFIILFNLKWVKWLYKIRILKNWTVKLKDLKSISNPLKCYVLGVSFFRYLIFIVQFYLLTTAFNMQLTPLDLAVYLGLLFGVVTFIPSLIPGNLGAKEAFSIVLLGGGLIAIKFSIICFIVWFINVAFSALMGAVILLAKGK